MGWGDSPRRRRQYDLRPPTHPLFLPPFTTTGLRERGNLKPRLLLGMHGHLICFLFLHFWGKKISFLKSDKFGVRYLALFFFPDLSLFLLSCPVLCSPLLPPFLPCTPGKKVNKLGARQERTPYPPHPIALPKLIPGRRGSKKGRKTNFQGTK